MLQTTMNREALELICSVCVMQVFVSVISCVKTPTFIAASAGIWARNIAIFKSASHFVVG